jgi:nicotinate phosphoribosyltransferase
MQPYSPLLTDFYQLTMAYGYWQLQRAEQEAVFQLTFRKNPFAGNYTIACGLATVIEFLQNFHFSESDIEFLRQQKLPNGKQFFSNEFLQYLATLKLTCDVDAVIEGTLIFPQEPLLRIKGPLLQCQLVETTLLNFLNFASLVATRSAQICSIAQGNPVIEFGLRRAQGPDGGMTASRAAYIGGCESTSNVLAGKEFNIPSKGTVAHSWIMSYPDELTAFQKFAEVIDLTIFLVDTYDSIQGIKNAIEVGRQLKKEGREFLGIRLDSGDLLKLSKKARILLDAAGFKKTKIFVSGDLDAEKIAKLKAQKAPIDVWGVGTKLVTAYEQPSLDAIYKLTAIKEKNEWLYKMKISDAPNKMTWPGIHQVRRYYQGDKFVHDVIYDTHKGIASKPPARSNYFQDLLIPIFKNGKLVYQSPATAAIRDFCLQQVKNFRNSRKLVYPIKIDSNLEKIRKSCLENLRNPSLL